MRKVMPSELVLNQPLPWSLYDQYGNLLLKAGYIISIPKHINSLVVRGAYTDAPLPQRTPQTVGFTDPHADEPLTDMAGSPPPRFHPLAVFARVDALSMTLERLHVHLMAQTLLGKMSTVVRSLANAVMETCTDNTDALIAACHLDRQHTYLVVQQLLSTTLTEITAREIGMDTPTRLSLACAALTRDISLLPVQQQLDQQTTPLDAEQIALLRSHPERTNAMLQTMGVDDAVWMEFVLQHHERLDGSGYPRALQGDAVSVGARILAIADSYSAMVTPRPNRVGLLPHEALRALQTQQGGLYDPSLLEQFARAVTDYPPGTLVHLANGKIGAIRSRKKLQGYPDLWLLYSDNGMPMMHPKRCDASDPAYAITRILRVEECRAIDVVMKRLWTLS